MNAPEHRRMNELLDRASRKAWKGPDHSPRVDQHLKGISMNQRPRPTLTRNAIILIGVGALGAGSLAAAVTHSVLSRRATLITDDGRQYDVQLSETAEGAAGTFVTDDGTVFGIEMVESGGEKNVTVDVNSPTGGTSTVILDDGVAPRVTTLPGQTATIQIGARERSDETDADKPTDQTESDDD